MGLLKHYCFTAGHHFDKYRKLNIKNPLFTQMADFFVFFGGECGVERGMDVLLRWLWEWKGLVQREGQARSPTKSEWDSGVLEGLVRGEGS